MHLFLIKNTLFIYISNHFDKIINWWKATVEINRIVDWALHRWFLSSFDKKSLDQYLPLDKIISAISKYLVIVVALLTLTLDCGYILFIYGNIILWTSEMKIDKLSTFLFDKIYFILTIILRPCYKIRSWFWFGWSKERSSNSIVLKFYISWVGVLFFYVGRSCRINVKSVSVTRCRTMMPTILSFIFWSSLMFYLSI